MRQSGNGGEMVTDTGRKGKATKVMWLSQGRRARRELLNIEEVDTLLMGRFGISSVTGQEDVQWLMEQLNKLIEHKQRESGADPRTTGAEGLPKEARTPREELIQSVINQLKHALERIRRYAGERQDYALNNCYETADGILRRAPWMELGTRAATQRAPVTPPDAGKLWLTGEQLERMHTEHTTGPDPETLNTNWDDLASDVRVLAAPSPVTTPGRDELIQALRSLPVHKIGSGNSSWDDVEPTEYVKLSDLNAALAAAKEPRG